MKDIGLYFNMGVSHILTWDALDHILFILALSLRYQFRDWRKLVLVISAFTIGHCSTLLIGAYNLFSVPTGLTEFLISLTIIFTAVRNVAMRDLTVHSRSWFIYLITLAFGMIHGLGFAYSLKSILGRNANILWQLLGFNAGIEVAQLVVILIALSITFIFIHILQVHNRSWNLFINGIILGLALQMAFQRNPFKKHDDEEVAFIDSSDHRRAGIFTVTIL